MSQDYVTVRITYNERIGERIDWEIPISRALRDEQAPIVRSARETRYGPFQTLVVLPTTQQKRRVGQAVREARAAGYPVNVY